MQWRLSYPITATLINLLLLIGVEDRRLASAADGLIHKLNAKLHIHGVGQTAGQHPAAQRWQEVPLAVNDGQGDSSSRKATPLAPMRDLSRSYRQNSPNRTRLVPPSTSYVSRAREADQNSTTSTSITKKSVENY